MVDGGAWSELEDQASTRARLPAESVNLTEAEQAHGLDRTKANFRARVGACGLGGSD